MIISIEQRPGELVISYVNKEGEVAFKKLNIPPQQQYCYLYAYRNAHPKVRSWDGKPVRKVPSQFLTKSRIQELFVDLEDKLSDIFVKNKPKLSAADIEVDVDDSGFPEAGEAKNRINSISWSNYPEVVVFGNKPLSSEQIQRIEGEINDHIKSRNKKYNLTYKYHENETDLIFDFLYNYVRHDTILTGWNFWRYDWQYIINRCSRLNLDISWLSPTKQWYQHKVSDRGKSLYIPLPQHKLIVDYMSIYQKYNRSIEIKVSDKLDYVGEKATGLRKVKYKGTFQDLYNKDFDKYVFYNAIDTILVEEIDEELETMETFTSIGNVTKIETMSAFSPIAMLQATLARYAYEKGLVFPKVKSDRKRDEYEGAFVFEPEPNLYGWVASFDFASLYPSIIRQFKISIENFVKKDKNATPNANQIQCSSGAIFDTSKEPLLPEILTDYYNKRKIAQKSMRQAEIEANRLKKILDERKAKSADSIS